MKNIKLNTSTKYKNNKFQIKYLKAKKNDIILFAVYAAQWDKEDGIFYRAYNFFIYFNRNKRVHYIIGNNSTAYYTLISNNNMSSFMDSFQRDAKRFLDNVLN
jgi:hypothetical protein